jgi:hypothetical protein
MLGVGIWSVTQKSSYKELSSIATDPAAVLIAVGCLIIIISFCGTVGALRENICLLETVSSLHECIYSICHKNVIGSIFFYIV